MLNKCSMIKLLNYTDLHDLLFTDLFNLFFLPGSLLIEMQIIGTADL